MIIGNIGWSGNKNWGDDRMAYCLDRFFHSDKIVHFNGFLEAIEHPDKLNSCDYILIGGGGLIFRGFNRYAPFLQSIRKPFGCIGVSIEADRINPDMTDGLNLLKTHSDFIYVRDKKSKMLLNHHHNVIVGPDISFLYPYKPLQITGKGVALNLRNWPWWDRELFSQSDELFGKIDRKFPLFQQIYPFKKWEVKKFVSKLKREIRHISPVPFYFGSYDVSDETYLKQLFVKVPNFACPRLFRSSRLLIGMRLHSLIFATQMGLPFISLSYEPKNENYCNDLGHPELSLPLIEWRRIKEKVMHVTDHNEDIRSDLLSYTRKSTKLSWHIFERIETLMHQRHSRKP